MCGGGWFFFFFFFIIFYINKKNFFIFFIYKKKKINLFFTNKKKKIIKKKKKKKKPGLWQGIVTHTYKPSSLGGWGRGITSSKPASATLSETLIVKLKERAENVAQWLSAPGFTPGKNKTQQQNTKTKNQKMQISNFCILK